MMTIAEAISELLWMHDTVVVQGLGAFVMKPVSAKVDLETNVFTPPTSRLEFNAAMRRENDLVIRYLCENNGSTEEEASKMLDDFVTECFDVLKRGEAFVLEGIGSLTYDSKGELIFTPSDSVNYNSEAFGLSAFTASTVVHDKKEEEITIQEDKTVPEDEPDQPKKRTVWYWVIAAACVLIGGFFGLRQIGGSGQEPVNPTQVNNSPSTQEVVPTVTHDSIELEQQEVDTIPVQPLDLNREIAETEYRVIAGCYDREENALWFANVLQGAGFAETFYEKRGERWFVSFAHYATYEEALDALMEIRNHTNYQAWILVPHAQ